MNNLQKYAKLIINVGINIQTGQNLVINSPIETANFARALMEEAYSAGAREVFIRWNDDLTSKIKLLNDPDEVIDNFPNWLKEFYTAYSETDTAFLSISAADPEALKGVNPERIVRQQKVTSKAIEGYISKIMAHDLSWCVVSIPTVNWAKKVFPESKSDSEAVDLLWDAIFKATRVYEENPVEAWKIHLENLKKYREFMNDKQFKSLHFSNSLGTDLTVNLVNNHIWGGGSDANKKGVEFVANIPTEEIFTMPHKTGVNGVVYSSKPLVYNGNLIENFRLKFENGSVVEVSAETGEEILKEMLNADEGSRRLGEVALVQFDSPISNANTLYYKTLFDENASCHLAFGRAYPSNLKEAAKYSKDELSEIGVNDSAIHVDFMIGTKDMNIVGVQKDGSKVQIFENGNFVI
ncbi:aminopeptidase [bacterium]|nr:aminopeptidase [bacterium]